MSYAPPAGGFPAPPAAAPPVRDRARALPGLAVILIAGLVLELAVLGFDLNQAGSSYLLTALGFSFGGIGGQSPVNFFGSDSATCVALVVMIIAGFSGRSWMRSAGTTLLLVNAYGSFEVLSTQLTDSDESRHVFASPISHLLLNLDEIAQIGLAVIFAVVVTATVRRTGPAVPPTGFAAPYPQPGGYAPPPPAAYAYPPAPGTDRPAGA